MSKRTSTSCHMNGCLHWSEAHVCNCVLPDKEFNRCQNESNRLYKDITVSIHHFDGPSFNDIAGYDHGQEIEVKDMMKVVSDLFSKRLNVMLARHSEGILIRTDTRQFQQR